MIGWILWIATLIGFGIYFFRKRLMEKRHEAQQALSRNNNGHYTELWDLGPRCIHNVPLSKYTKECAWPIAHCYETPMPTDEERKIKK